jgi:hypothetical protein
MSSAWGNGSQQRRDNVNMIRDTANVHQFGSEVAADCRQISMHAWPHV